MMNVSLKQKISTNWKAGLTVGLVSLPLAVSLAVASHTTPLAGVITAIWAGLFASLFGGSNFNVIGPTGAFAGVLFGYVNIFGGSCLPMLAILSGIFIFIAYIFMFEKYLTFIPGSALHGFILGVAIIIILNQIEPLFGFVTLPKHATPFGTLYEAFRNINFISIPSLLIFLVTYIGLVVFQRFIAWLPGTIVLTPIGIGLGYLCAQGILPWVIPTLGSKFPNMQGAIFQLPAFHFKVAYLLPAVSIATIAILETMISARVADGVTKTKHNKRKEMFGLSLANIASGLTGGIPATAALGRTALNITSGCNDKLAATISSIFIALASLFFLYYFQYLPLAVIAAILVFVALGMLEAEHFTHMYKTDRKSFVIALIVAFLTVYEDAVVGILFGSVVAMLLLMQRLSVGYHETTISTPKQEPTTGEKKLHKEANTMIYSIKGPLAYINTQAHLARFETISVTYTDVILNLHDVHFIDLDGIETLSEIVETLSRKKIRVFITSLKPMVESLLVENKTFKTLQEQNHVFATISQALQAIASTPVTKTP